MKRKKSASLNAKKETIHKEEKKLIPSWISFRLFILLLLLLAGIVWFGFYATHTKEISGSDDREYASIARNIVNGKGIVRNFIYPVDINFFEKLPVPEFMHPPDIPSSLPDFLNYLESQTLLLYFLPIYPISFSSFFFSFLLKGFWRSKRQSSQR